jgi:hypothetical protein
VIERFRTSVGGKARPVLLYWGGFDLSHSRFTGRSLTPPADAPPWLRYGEDGARWEPSMGEFVLPYEAVLTAPSPDETALAFFESVHAAKPRLANWDTEALAAHVPAGNGQQ